MIPEVSHSLRNLGVKSERIYQESLFNRRSDPDQNSVAELDNPLTAAGVERPIDFLEREVTQYGSTWQETA